MCCEECPKYEKCTEEDKLKDDCCKRCPEYNNCVGTDSKENISYNDDSDYYDS